MGKAIRHSLTSCSLKQGGIVRAEQGTVQTNTSNQLIHNSHDTDGTIPTATNNHQTQTDTVTVHRGGDLQDLMIATEDRETVKPEDDTRADSLAEETSINSTRDEISEAWERAESDDNSFPLTVGNVPPPSGGHCHC